MDDEPVDEGPVENGLVDGGLAEDDGSCEGTVGSTTGVLSR